ncbi:hypothetical protein Bca101_076071 [Brassica carinata]
MGVDMLLLDSQYRQRSTAEDSILDISREFEFVEQSKSSCSASTIKICVLYF